MKNSKVLIATPMMHQISTQFYMSMMSLRGTGEIASAIEMGSLVYMSRNKLALKAIQGGFDYIVWIDSDMVFQPDLIKRFMENAQYDRDFVASLCFRRCFPTQPVIFKEIVYHTKENGEVIHDAIPYLDYPKNKTFEIGGAGFGCCLTKVSMIKDVAEKFKLAPFDPLPFLGEDYSFCWKAKQIGYKLWCDSRIKVGHVGEYVYDEEAWLAQEKAEKAEGGK